MKPKLSRAPELADFHSDLLITFNQFINVLRQLVSAGDELQFEQSGAHFVVQDGLSCLSLSRCDGFLSPLDGAGHLFRLSFCQLGQGWRLQL